MAMTTTTKSYDHHKAGWPQHESYRVDGEGKEPPGNQRSEHVPGPDTRSAEVTRWSAQLPGEEALLINWCRGNWLAISKIK